MPIDFFKKPEPVGPAEAFNSVANRFNVLEEDFFVRQSLDAADEIAAEGEESLQKFIAETTPDPSPLTDEVIPLDIQPLGNLGNLGDTAPAAPAAPSAPQSPGGFDPASFTFNREARRDSKGRLRVYKPPSGDGGGAFEVAGITARFQPNESRRLKQLIESGNHAQAEREAKDFFRKRAEPFLPAARGNPGLQLQIADSVHHRGEGGLRRILQRATGSNSKSHTDLIARLSADPESLAKFNRARIAYELEEVDRGRESRKRFRKGLLNRFRQANQAAREANNSI